MQRQPVLIPTKLEKGKDASYKAVERLRENLDTEGVHNIGITGPYGSGKSSVVKTLIKEDENKHHFLELSLATLDDKEAEKDEKKIEANLLKQMIYREKQETLPNSRFRRVQYLAPRPLWLKAAWIICCIVAFAIAFEPSFLIIDTLYDFFNWGNLNIWFDALSLIILLGTLLYLAAYVVRTYGRSKLSKLNIADGEIELKDEGSVLSEHLAEILYFFQETDYDVVVFEDLDRFENKKIFLKLRELNYILNKCKELNGRNIRFIYAVKDDMFKDSSRTKFFDNLRLCAEMLNNDYKVRKIILFVLGFIFSYYFCTQSTINHTLMDIGKVIKERRALLGISQQDLSDFSGVGISTVKDLERGVGNPSIDTLRKILDVVGLEMILQVKQTVK